MADNSLKGNYKETETYKKADAQKKAQIERYRKENKLDSGQMYLVLLREDYRNLPKEEKQKGNRIAELLVLSGIITFLALTARQNKEMLPFAAVYLIIVTAVYFSGILNPIGRQLSNINKLIRKSCPDLPPLKKYLEGEKEEE